VGVNDRDCGLDFEEGLKDLLCQIFGLVKALRVVAEGVLKIEGVLVGDLEGEVTGFAIESGVSGDSEAFGVVEDDDGVLMGDARVEPGETAAGELDLGRIAGLNGCVGGGDVSLELTLDLVEVFFKAGDEGGEEGLSLGGDDAGLVLRA
jgi:hypothetical protein